MDKKKLDRIMHAAHRAGASALKVIGAKEIVVEQRLADMCIKPGCENYGLSKSCPPHVPGPSGFIKLLKNYTIAVFFKIDLTSEILFSDERHEFFRLLHEVAAGIETDAVRLGFVKAKAFAGGSCKQLFCNEFPECLALSGKGECRNPDHARPSMSGFGINVSKLIKAAEWGKPTAALGTGLNRDTVKKANIYGLVLIE